MGEGNRQYLTGLNLGGQRIAIMVDASASMLANQLVNVIRLRNMDPALQKAGWQMDKDTRYGGLAHCAITGECAISGDHL